MLLIGLWTLALLPAWGVGVLLTLPWPARRVAWRGLIVRRWARGMARLLGMRIRVTGTPPRPPFFLVSNHLSYVDVILLMTRLRASFIAKSEVRAWPIIGGLGGLLGTLFIDRKNRKDILRVNGLIEAALRHGDGVVFFPEGTSSKGDRVYAFKAPLLDLAVRAAYLVTYASISYRTPPGETPAHLAVCWWGDMTFTDHFFRLLQLPHFEATLVFGDEAIREDDRKTLARRLEAQVQQHFIPVVTPDPL